MELSRKWEMPSIWTFKMKSVQQIFEKYKVGHGWADPFAGENSPAQFANDIEGRGNQYQMDALEFLKSLPDNSVSGVLFDPPYSVEQCLRRYTPKQGGTAGRAEYWAKCKDEIKRICKEGATVISFCWDSTGMGKSVALKLLKSCLSVTVLAIMILSSRLKMRFLTTACTLTAFSVGRLWQIPCKRHGWQKYLPLQPAAGKANR